MKNRPNALQKLIYVFTMFGCSFLAATLGKGLDNGPASAISAVLFFISFLSFPALIALGIDHIRLNTNWHPLLKLFSFLLIFLTGLILMAIYFYIADLNNWFR